MLNVFKNSTNLKDMSYAYANITNIKGDFTVPHNNITNAANCFYGKSNLNQLNIIANFGTTSHNAFLVGMTNAGNGQIYSYNNTANIVMFNMQTTSMANAFYNDQAITKAACGPNVTNMANTYIRCSNLTGSPVCGNNVTSMHYTYYYCSNLTGSPICGPKVTNMYCAYSYCDKLTGSFVCGNNVTNFGFAYCNCSKLTGNPVCGPNVTNMYCTYENCTGLYGDMIVYSNNVSNATDCFLGRNNSKQLTISVNFGTTSYDSFKANNINGSSLSWTKAGDGSIYYYNKPANIVIFNMQTTNMDNTFKNDTSVKIAACGPYVTNMSFAYYNCINLTGNPVCGNNVTNMYNAYVNCSKLTGSPVCGPNVGYMAYAYRNCHKLTGSPVCGSNVTNMYSTYYNCYNLTGSPVCGPNVTNMAYTYHCCNKLTGQPVCGNNVIDMHWAYRNCINLTGSPVCGPNVTNMHYTYRNCINLTGNPVCGDKVTDMTGTYSGCSSLTGAPVCGLNVTDMTDAYYNCPNLSSNGYFYSNKITDVRDCFAGRNTSKRLNLYVPAGSTTLTTCLGATNSSSSLTGANIVWTNDTANNRYYNTAQNIYIYPVANVEDAYKYSRQ